MAALGIVARALLCVTLACLAAPGSARQSPRCSCACCVARPWQGSAKCLPVYQSQSFLHRGFATCQSSNEPGGQLCYLNKEDMATVNVREGEVDVASFCFAHCAPSVMSAADVSYGSECVLANTVPSFRQQFKYEGSRRTTLRMGVQSQLCLERSSGRLVRDACDDSKQANQQFILEKNPGKPGTIRLAADVNQCLHVVYGGDLNGNSLHFGQCNEAMKKEESFVLDPKTSVIRWAVHPDLCFNVAPTDEAKMVMWHCEDQEHPPLEFTAPEFKAQ